MCVCNVCVCVCVCVIAGSVGVGTVSWVMEWVRWVDAVKRGCHGNNIL